MPAMLPANIRSTTQNRPNARHKTQLGICRLRACWGGLHKSKVMIAKKPKTKNQKPKKKL
jgi:hypothetical protein